MRKEAEEKPAEIRNAESEERDRKKEQRLVEAQNEAALERQKYALDRKGKVVEEVEEDEEDDEGPPPPTDTTNVSSPADSIGSEAIVADKDIVTEESSDPPVSSPTSIAAETTTKDPADVGGPPTTTIGLEASDIDTAKVIGDIADKDVAAEEPSDPPVSSSSTSITAEATTKDKDGAALIQESLAMLRKQKQCIKMSEDTDTGFAWSDELDSALIRHATATGFDPDETIARLSKDFPALVPSLDESLFTQRLGVLGLLQPKEKGRNPGAGEDRSPTTTTPTTSTAGIPLIAGKKELLKSNTTRRIVLPPVKLPSSCDDTDDITPDPDVSLNAYLKQRGGLHVAVEKECVEDEDGKEVLDVSIASAESDIFYDAKETLTPIK